MRTKEQITKDVEEFAEVGDYEPYLIEVLIDIRDRLDSIAVRVYDTKETIERGVRRMG